MRHAIQSFAGRVLKVQDRMTVRAQIAVAVGAMAMVLIGALAIGAALVSYRNTEALTNARLDSIASITAERLDRYMAVRQQEVQLFSKLEPMKAQWEKDPVALRRTLEQMQATFTDFAWIGFARADGVVLAATGGLLEGKSVAQRPWFQTGLSVPVVHDVHEAALLSSLLAQRSDGEPYRFVDIALPVRDDAGRVLGVLGAHLNWSWASNVIASAEASESNDIAINVLSKAGKVLIGPAIGSAPFADERLQEILRMRAGTFIETSGHADRLTAFYVGKGHLDYQGLNWIVTASQPASVALAAAIHTAKTILVIGAIAGVAGVALAFFIAVRISRPIRALTVEADRIGRASGPTMLPRQNGSVEVVQLTRALRALLRRIGFAEEQTRDVEARANEQAIQLKDDISELRRLADTDYLTNLMNRRAFLAAGDDALAFSLRYRRNLAVLMIDIDHFKLINDTHGHAVGDDAIRGVATIVNTHIKGTDRTARFGGEEFVVLLREVNEAAALLVAERIRTAVAQTVLTLGTIQISATVSVGIALLADSDGDVQDLIERADRGLYQAKDEGRNRSVFMPALPAPGLQAA